MFARSADIYDAVYHWKDYGQEARRVWEIVSGVMSPRLERSGERGHYPTPGRRSKGVELLDVACGTGGHISHLREWFDVEGLDLDDGLLDIARRRHPGVTFHQGDMTDFDLGKRYDVVVCLFSAIGYARTVSGLRSSIASMERHLAPGGVLIVEPWIFDGEYMVDHLSATYVDGDDLKISRMNVSRIEQTEENPVSIVDFYYQVGRTSNSLPGGEGGGEVRPSIVQFTERHELGLFRRDQYEDAFRACGLSVDFDADGLMKRGLYIGRK